MKKINARDGYREYARLQRVIDAAYAETNALLARAGRDLATFQVNDIFGMRDMETNRITYYVVSKLFSVTDSKRRILLPAVYARVCTRGGLIRGRQFRMSGASLAQAFKVDKS